jgi:hypothetical protein
LRSTYGDGECRICGDLISGQYTFCIPCWQVIPADQKTAIVVEYTPGVAPSKQTSRAYWDAVEAASSR